MAVPCAGASKGGAEEGTGAGWAAAPPATSRERRMTARTPISGLLVPREAAEEAVVVPARPGVGIGDAQRQRGDEIVQADLVVGEDALRRIVGRAVIDVAPPRRLGRRLGRARREAELEGERRNALLDEAVL